MILVGSQILGLTNSTLNAQDIKLKYQYQAAPVDNPLKGLVPYEGQGGPFPHSLEFSYFPLNKLMTGPNRFDWSLLETTLNRMAQRGCQAVIRVYIEYPGKASAIPQHLRTDVGVNRYTFEGNQNHTPDYSNPKLRLALKRFVSAFGKKYDGDPRIGFITMGLLGHWGEWHTYPKSELFASKQVQTEVMDSFESSFRKTKVLMRYPAGDQTWQKAANHRRNFGYHDDSFAWATLPTGRPEDDWFFVAALEQAGKEAVDKWKSAPIGGEIRPEIWGCVFDQPSCAPRGQAFEDCVRATHVSWLMDSGMFADSNPESIKRRSPEATKQVQKMGYEMFVREMLLENSPNKTSIELSVTNRGVAPFYYNWPVELSITSTNGKTIKQKTSWKLTDVMPGKTTKWSANIALPQNMITKLSIRAIHPLENGKPFRFANKNQQPDGTLRLFNRK